MATKTAALSIRLDQDLSNYLVKIAKTHGVTKTDVISQCLLNDMQKGFSVKKLAEGGQIGSDALNTDEMKLLMSVGVGTAAGVAGYQISKYIRHRYEKDPNEAADMLVALVVGITTMIATMNKLEK